MAFVRQDFVELDNVLEVAEQAEDFNFIVEESFVDFPLDILHVDEFEGECLSLVRDGLPVESC
jgi:hypothetical protein